MIAEGKGEALSAEGEWLTFEDPRRARRNLRTLRRPVLPLTDNGSDDSVVL